MSMKAKEVRRLLRTTGSISVVATVIVSGNPIWISVSKSDMLYQMRGIKSGVEVDAMLEDHVIYFGLDLGRREAKKGC